MVEDMEFWLKWSQEEDGRMFVCNVGSIVF
jgi:hypothetical protein